MVSKFMVHKEVYNKWPAKGEKPSGESFDVDLIDMSEPAEHSYRGMLPYRLTPEEKTKYWGKLERREVNIGVHSILRLQTMFCQSKKRSSFARLCRSCGLSQPLIGS